MQVLHPDRQLRIELPHMAIAELSRYASVSVDVDSITSHLMGYGIRDTSDESSVYRTALPRAMDLFKRMGVQATFFLIAQEAIRFPEIVRSIGAVGHEVACHSMTHALPFDLSDPTQCRREIVESKQVLEKTTGGPVVGFRAPSWDASANLLDRVASAGYSYDASSYPSWMLPLLRWSVARRSFVGRDKASEPSGQNSFGIPHPHVICCAWKELVEIPLMTLPLIRIPYYHTLRFLLSDDAFRCISLLARARRGLHTYVFHAVDFLEVNADRLDSRIGRHPGMNCPLERKLWLAEQSLLELCRKRNPVSLRSISQIVLAHHV